jgi:hypothetical protein
MNFLLVNYLIIPWLAKNMKEMDVMLMQVGRTFNKQKK